ncbi:MAG: hypothetical protein K9K37_09315 [Desulfocapsa sp.]|nr:hypothetical protein [Desulfocapsa sp.]
MTNSFIKKTKTFWPNKLSKILLVLLSLCFIGLGCNIVCDIMHCDVWKQQGITDLPGIMK